jgi:hypothetical protein
MIILPGFHEKSTRKIKVLFGGEKMRKLMKTRPEADCNCET